MVIGKLIQRSFETEGHRYKARVRGASTGSGGNLNGANDRTPGRGQASRALLLPSCYYSPNRGSGADAENDFVMRPIAVAWIVIGFIATAGSLPTATAGRPSERIELGRSNVISGDRPSALKVHIPESVKVGNPWLKRTKDVIVSGQGRFVGFALIPDPVSDRAVAYIGGRLPASAGDRTFFFHANSFPSANQEKTITIEKGDYLFVLLTEKDPVTVALQLKGLEGHVRASPTLPTTFEQTPMTSNDPGLGDNYYSGQATAPLHNGGLLFQAAWLETEAHVATHHLACFWGGEPPFPDRHNPPSCEMVPGVFERENIMRSQETIDPHPGVGTNLKIFYGSELVTPSKRKKNDTFRVGQSYALETAAVGASVHDIAMWISLPKRL